MDEGYDGLYPLFIWAKLEGKEDTCKGLNKFGGIRDMKGNKGIRGFTLLKQVSEIMFSGKLEGLGSIDLKIILANFITD